MERVVEWLIFTSRWLLVPMYLGLALLLPVFAVKFYEEMWHLVRVVLRAEEADFILGTLALIDMVLVANLLVMIVISGYETFVSRIDLSAEDEKDKPSWLGKLDAGTLKIKVAASIVAISSIHLLKAFMNVERFGNDKLMWLVIIHLAFVVSALLLAYVDKVAFRYEKKMSI
ncbi:MAG: TIGR00645 family protein [Alphaproteobacteria bacterium]|nr:TIGR00645 family protein [Alphaproteobacteria bacterium]